MEKDNVYGVIYKIVNKINNKIYIGQTTRRNGFKERYQCKGEGIERVYNFYDSKIKYGEKYNLHLYSSIKKYGFESFDVIEEFDVAYSKYELDSKEIYWIKYYKSSDDKYGYNQTKGGDGFHYGKSAYISRLGENRKPIICIETNEVFLTITDASKDTGICDTLIRKICVGELRSGFSKIHNKKLSFEYIDLNKKTVRPVICLTTNKLFKNPNEASDYYNIDASSIYKNCSGKSKSAGKHPETGEKLIWMFQLDCKIKIELEGNKISELMHRKEKNNIRIEKLYAGQIFKNYREMCEELEMEFKGTYGKNIQLTELSKYCKLNRIGHKFTIEEVYETIN